MHTVLKKIFVCSSSTFISLLAVAQVNFHSSIQPARINKDDYATLKLTVDNASDIQNIIPPSLKKFRIISGPNQESGMSNINGVVKQYISLSYVLQPLQAGTIEIGNATAIVSGKKLTSAPLSLVVKNASSGNNNAQSYSNASPLTLMDPFVEERRSNDYDDYILRKNENVQEKVSKNMEMKLVTDKTSCYVGEPIVAAYKLYTRLKSDSKLTKNPSFNGFSVIDLQQPSVTGYAQEKLNGREYNVYTIRKAQLYPLQSGNIELETASLENNLQFIKEESLQRRSGPGSFMDDLLMPAGEAVNETVTLSSKPITIAVKPLPEVGKPANFGGAVGEFTIASKLEKTNFSTDETGKLLVTISGAGNLQLINAPEIKWPAGIDGFEPSAQDKYNMASVPLKGDKVFEYSFSVQSPGKFILPSVSFSFFNPHTATYKTISTAPVTLEISQGKNEHAATTNAVVNVSSSTAGSSLDSRQVMMVAAALIALGLFVWLNRRNKKNNNIELVEKPEPTTAMESIISNAAYNQQNPLEKTEACLDSEECFEFYALLNKELKAFLAAKLSLSDTEMNSRKIINAMDSSGMDNNTILELQQLMQEIEWMLYTPFERSEKMKELYNRAQDIIQTINTTLRHQLTL